MSNFNCTRVTLTGKRVRVILLSLGASVLAHPMRPTFAQMESRRKIKQMSKMEPLCIHSHDSRFCFKLSFRVGQKKNIIANYNHL